MTVESRVVRALHRLRLARVRTKHLGSNFTVGHDFIIGHGAVLARRASIQAGERVSVGHRLTLLADLTIGNDVMISANVGFIGDDHPFDDSDAPLTSFTPRALARIRLEGDNLIGYGSTIIGNTTIGYGAIVGAGSVVTKDVPRGAVVTGSPADITRFRRANS